MDAWSYVYLAAMGFAVLMVGRDFFKWLFKDKPFSDLAKIFLLELDSKVTFVPGIGICDYYGDIMTTSRISIKSDKYGYVFCLLGSGEVTNKLTRSEYKAIKKKYNEVMLKQYTETLVLAQKDNSSCTK